MAFARADFAEIARLHIHRAAVRGFIANNGEAAVIGGLQPLVPVGRPRIGAFDPIEQVAMPLARPRPQPERAINVEPAARRAHQRHDFGEGIADPGVDLPGLADDDRWVAASFQRAFDRTR